MRHIQVARVLPVAWILVVLTGCATTPLVSRNSPNYIQTGMESPRFQGGEFYMVIGDVDLYQYDLFGNLEPTGQTVEIATAVQADKATGRILRIATLQPADARGVTVRDGGEEVLANLRGGISVIDVQPYPHWLGAIQAMRKAIGQLKTYTQFAAGNERTTVVVAVDPLWHWWWPWHYRHHRHWR